LSQKILGRITNYRTGIREQTSKECLIEFKGVESLATAGRLVGKKVAWKGEKKTLIGKVVGPHGRNGMVKVKFAHGVPGQAIGTIVELVS
jgi:large subunit ribosomal protein L35Ae